ncbi:MAG: PEP-CTERM sorting domain-containing protein [Bryobacteraceae bacterium]
MRQTILYISILAIICSAGLYASPVYSNTTTDTFDTVFFSVGPYSGLGDQVLLATGDRFATDATVQFFNNGSDGTFDAILRLYQIGAPVGAQIGSDFTVTGISAPTQSVFNVVFNTGYTAVPDELIFLVYLTNTSAGLDLGLNMFEPPTVGSSDNAFMVSDAGGFSQLGTNAENVYFQLDATTPEPGTFAMFGGGLLAAILVNRRRLAS